MRIASFVTFLVLVPGPAVALDTWYQPNPGIGMLVRTTPAPATMRALVVDLRQSGVGLVATPADTRWETTSAFAERSGVAAAINGGPWSLYGQRVLGLAAGSGSVWSLPDGQHGALFADADGGVQIAAADELSHVDSSRIAEAVSGRPMLVEECKLASGIELERGGRDARTAVGLSATGDRLVAVVVDGRQESSIGATLAEVGRLLIELGACTALNLDGGKSATLWVAAQDGRISEPVLGFERESVSHLGIRAPDWESGPPPPKTRATPAYALQDARRPIGLSARGLRARLSPINLLDRLFVGAAREWMVPGFLAAGVLLLVVILGSVLRRLLYAVRS